MAKHAVVDASGDARGPRRSRAYLVGALVSSMLPVVACSLDAEGTGFPTPSPPQGSTRADDAGDTSADGGESETGPTPDDAAEVSETGTDDPGADPVCGDGTREGDEACDGADFGGQSCEDFGFDGGVLACTATCTLDTDACHACGDGTRDDGETCDGNDLAGETCQTQGYTSGTLTCAADCQAFDTTGCGLCGNGVVETGEQCDGGNLNGRTCQTEGFDMGQLACTGACTFDHGGCSNCGGIGQLCSTDDDCCPAGIGGNIVGQCSNFHICG